MTRRPVRVIVGIVIVATAVVGISVRVTEHRPSVAAIVLRGVKIPSFTLLREVDASFSGNIDASGLYIGPSESGTSLIAALNAQGFRMVQLTSDRPGLSGVYGGKLKIFSSGRANPACGSGLATPSGISFPVDGIVFTASQTSGVKNGSLELVELDIVCGAG